MRDRYRNREKRSAKPNNFSHRMQKFVAKIFGFFKEVLHLLFLLVENTMRLITFLFSLLVRLLANPIAPCIVAIIAFVAVCLVALAQWASIGVWLGQVLGIKGLWNIGSASCGVLLGIGINIYQLSPQLWKIRKDISRAYLHLGIDVETPEKGENPQDKLDNWLTIDHGMLKTARLFSYGLEAALVLGWAFSTGLNFYTLALAAVSLLLPEKCLMLVSSTVSVLGKVSDNLNNHPEPPEDHVSFS